MPTQPFDAMPDRGRLWVFAADRPLGDGDARDLLDRVDAFLADWKAHGQPLLNARDWREGRFLLVAVDPASEPPSGCSIDALLRVLKEAEASLGVGLTDHAPVHYRDGGDVRTASRADFRSRAREGSVDADTPVFDTTLTSVGALRELGLERPAREAWHGPAFFGAARGARAGG